MRNEGLFKMIKKRNIDIMFTLGNNTTMINVLHVPDMNRNLACGVLFEKLESYLYLI